MAESKPVIAVLCEAEEGEWPGLDPIAGEAELRFAFDADELRQIIGEADILLVTDFRSGAVEKAWSAAGRLKWVHATSAGVDPLMFGDLVDSDIPLTNARGVFDRGIAETVLGFVLAFAKDLPGNFALKRHHRWKHRDTESIEGAKALVVGAGSIGGEIGTLLMAAGMKADGVASAERDDPVFGRVYGNDALPGLLADYDYVVLATPLTEDTHHLIDGPAFAAMKDTARLINIGRGAVVDTEALVRALDEGAIAGAALDVFEEEPLPEDHPLWDREPVIISHHMAGDVIGWREKLSDQFIENFRRWRDGEALFNVVDKQKQAAQNR